MIRAIFIDALPDNYKPILNINLQDWHLPAVPSLNSLGGRVTVTGDSAHTMAMCELLLSYRNNVSFANSDKTVVKVSIMPFSMTTILLRPSKRYTIRLFLTHPKMLQRYKRAQFLHMKTTSDNVDPVQSGCVDRLVLKYMSGML